MGRMKGRGCGWISRHPPANFSRMSAITQAYICSPSGNCSATVRAPAWRSRHTVLWIWAWVSGGGGEGVGSTVLWIGVWVRGVRGGEQHGVVDLGERGERGERGQAAAAGAVPCDTGSGAIWMLEVLSAA